MPDDLQRLVGAVAFAVVFFVLTAGIVSAVRAWKRVPKARGTSRPEPDIPIAIIEEKIVMTTGGEVAVIMMLLNVLLCVFWFLIAKTIVEQAAAGAVFTGGAVMWGVCIICGRRRTYLVRRGPQSPP